MSGPNPDRSDADVSSGLNLICNTRVGFSYSPVFNYFRIIRVCSSQVHCFLIRVDYYQYHSWPYHVKPFLVYGVYRNTIYFTLDSYCILHCQADIGHANHCKGRSSTSNLDWSLDHPVPYIRGLCCSRPEIEQYHVWPPANNPNPDSSEALYYQKNPDGVYSGVLYCSTDTRHGLSFTTAKFDWYREDTDPRFYNDFRPMSFGEFSLTLMYSPLGQ
ncbi:hypothetical protein FMEXI_12106 [Fusarium mexicanum]|uniref:Uncharacterized protein n=1 Tax=Fusarium mexicanum TaxID=751941 RepID=A0A8H5I9G8_9HYPO|nr:hypothetical protein FMEXI_12106 [Fusarium mexicanum]